eukprot:scaffold19972_cov128-Isochrysis_galbana.AAC.8
MGVFAHLGAACAQLTTLEAAEAVVRVWRKPGIPRTCSETKRSRSTRAALFTTACASALSTPATPSAALDTAPLSPETTTLPNPLTSACTRHHPRWHARATRQKPGPPGCSPIPPLVERRRRLPLQPPAGLQQSEKRPREPSRPAPRAQPPGLLPAPLQSPAWHGKHRARRRWVPPLAAAAPPSRRLGPLASPAASARPADVQTPCIDCWAPQLAPAA